MPLLTADSPYTTVLMIDLLIAALFAASLHFIMGPAGMHSFGHAAYFGLGAYGAALLVRASGLPMESRWSSRRWSRRIGALVYGWFAVRLSGVYLAMLTLAFAQITWAVVYQWDASPAAATASPACGLRSGCRTSGVLLAHAGAGGGGFCGCGACCSRPSAMRCARAAIRCCAPMPSASTSSACSGPRSSSRARRRAWPASLYAFSKGSISPKA
jgi:hypothetical protein